MCYADLLGDTGEVLTAESLRKLGMNVIRNLYLPISNHLTEIDMVGIHACGIFVVENKNYSGIVAGRTKDKKWLSSSQGYIFSPLMQNSRHINVLRNTFPEYADNMHNVVIFNDRLDKLITDDSRVFVLSDFVEKFESLWSTRVFDADKISEIRNKLISYSDMSLEAKYIHKELLSNVGGS